VGGRRIGIGANVVGRRAAFCNLKPAIPPIDGLRVLSCADMSAERLAVSTFAAFEIPLAWICCTIEGVGVAPAAMLIAAEVLPLSIGVPI